MKFTRVRLSGFKSFAEPGELELADGLTGIVGPNGCGKSNIVEALRWVMGESSARGLRGTEMDDLVFAGSATRPPFDFAEVTLTIEGPVPELAAAGERIELVRRLIRGGGSTFRLGGREVRARDVQIMLADAATGARSAAIIGQGEIAGLVDARPDQRRRLLEEAAGIGGLHGRRREAELRLQATARNLELLEQRLAQLAKEHERLSKQAREAERFRKLRSEIRRLEGLRLLARHRTGAEALARLQSALAEVEQQAAALAGRRAELLRASDELHAARRRLEGERRQAAEALARIEERLALRARLAEEAARAREEARQRLQAAVAAEQRERQNIEALEARMQELRRAIADLRARLPELETGRMSATGELAAVGEELAELNRVLEGIDARAVQLTTELAQHRARAFALREQAAALDEAAADASVAELESELASLRARVGSLEAELAQRLSELQQQEEEQARLAAAREQAAAALASAELAAREAGDARRTLELQLRERCAAAAAVREKLALLDRQLARLDERAARLSRSRDSLAMAALEARLEALLADAARLQQDAGQARAAVCAAEAALAGIDEELRAAVAAQRTDETLAARLESEIGALVRLLPPTPPDALLHRLRVPADRARAIAALLGDDLLLGTDPSADSFWREDLARDANAAADPRPPAGCEPLADGLDLPPALLRALGAAGFVHNGEAERLQPLLQPGQSLVSRDGGLWRWDGLVRRPGATVEAARRLAVEREVADKRAALAAVRQQLTTRAARIAALETRRAAASEQLATARHALEEIEAALSARHAETERARSELAETQERRRGLVAELEEIGRERDELAAERAGLAERLEALSEEGEPASSLDLARAAERRAEDERQRCAAALASLVRRLRDLATDIAGRRDARERAAAELVAARAALEAGAERLARVSAEQARRAEARARLAAERQTVEARIAELEDRLATVHTERCRIAAERDARSQREQELRRELAALEARDREVSTQLERLTVELAHLERSLGEGRRRLAGATAAVREAHAVCERLEASVAEGEGTIAEADEPAALKDLLGQLEGQCTAVDQQLADQSAALAPIEAGLGELREQAASLRAEAGRVRAQLEELEREIGERSGRSVAELLEEGGQELARELAALDPEAVEMRLDKLRRAREGLGAVNLRAAQELAEIAQELASGRAQEQELRAAIERLRRAIARLDREGRERLRQAFEEVDRHFRALFVRLFGGGRAELRLTNLDDPFAAGLELDAMPPGKTLQHVSLLSGGEKSLAGLALIFAFFLARPSPLCVLDEVDAALDDANVERFVDVMEEIARATGTRFLVVTHHPLTMARMDRLYGVTMIERGVSRLVAVSLGDAVELRATA